MLIHYKIDIFFFFPFLFLSLLILLLKNKNVFSSFLQFLFLKKKRKSMMPRNNRIKSLILKIIIRLKEERVVCV